MKKLILALFASMALCAAAASAQPTTGSIIGRVLDDQGAAIPGASITVNSPATGFTRSDVTDAEGVYRLRALPVGTFDVTVELAGFTSLDRKGVVVNVGQTITIDFSMKVAAVAETVVVTGQTPLIEVSVSSVGGVVDIGRIESIPLNGRQFANLAATLPGVGLGNHSDPTKSTQYSPQINGGNGRNVNYQIDGGDNNDDTVGGLLQLFPLEAIQEFNFVTSRAKAENGRSNGGVMNIVTKSGTNTYRGSFFELFRDKALNSITTTEKNAGSEKQDYRRHQFGGSFGGPIVKDKVHYFGAAERTQQDTKQVVNTRGLFPSLDGVFDTPYRETLLNVKVTANATQNQYLSVRYGRNQNSQPYGATSLKPVNGWGQSKNEFNSINANHNWVLGGKLNEFIFQYADFSNNISANSQDPYEQFPNGVAIGQSPNTPQTTEQKKWQFRDDFSWHVTGMGGVGHDFKAGVNFINEPRLFITFNSGKGVIQHTHLTDVVGGPISTITLNDGDASANIPLKQYAGYVQDDWAVTDNLTLNIGLRYDLITGYQFDQSKNPNFVLMQAAGAAGRLAGIKGLENFGKDPKNDTNNWQPRLGFAYSLRGGKDVLRGGWGIYMDMAYTNSNALFAASDATGKGFGAVVSIDDQTGIKNPDGSFYRVGQPLANILSQNQSSGGTPVFGQFTDPRLQMPYTRQTSLGYSFQISESMVLTVDGVRADGRNLNSRPRINVGTVGAGNSGARQIAFVGVQPNAVGTRPAISQAESDYTALITGFKRRMTNNLDLTATYTLAKANSQIGTAADELNANNLQDARLLYDDERVNGPTSRTDARHQGSFAAVYLFKGLTVAPTFFYRSRLPLATITGVDTNLNRENNDITARAYQYAGVGKAPKDIGECKTYNCSRGAWRTQANLRLSYDIRLMGSARVTVIGEAFNLFNAENPAFALTQNQLSTSFMQPNAFAGDFQQGEQRLAQIGFRFAF